LQTVFDHDMPGVAVCLLVEHQTDFKDTQDLDKMRWQRYGDGPVALAGRKGKHRTVFLEGRVFPDGGTEVLAPVRECGVCKASLAQGPCGSTCPIEALLCGVDAMSMQGLDGCAAIAPAVPTLLRGP